MLNVSIDSLNAIEEGINPAYKVVVYFQEPETYTEDDYLLNAGDLSTSMSEDGGYEVANTSVTLRNQEYYFSRRLAKELPDNKLVEIFMNTGFEDILLFRGVVYDWQLTETELTLNINA
ncbi:MAG: hypothetical protein GXP46_01980 [Deferribacteres bacterium]|nr:hypothetical protein [Deferribacteres bacterium]